LDEKVSERVLYDILIQVGRVVDLHIPRDKETSRPKGFAFAEYESEEIAQYAVRLFSGLVRLHNRTLKFAVRFFLLPSYPICFSLDLSIFLWCRQLHFV
jgi:splicing factor 3B subunit 4